MCVWSELGAIAEVVCCTPYNPRTRVRLSSATIGEPWVNFCWQTGRRIDVKPTMVISTRCANDPASVEKRFLSSIDDHNKHMHVSLVSVKGPKTSFQVRFRFVSGSFQVRFGSSKIWTDFKTSFQVRFRFVSGSFHVRFRFVFTSIDASFKTRWSFDLATKFWNTTHGPINGRPMLYLACPVGANVCSDPLCRASWCFEFHLSCRCLCGGPW